MNIKLSVSNIAWDVEEEETLLPKFKGFGVNGVEVAPSKLWPNWEGVSEKSILEKRNFFYNQGLKIPALQAIFFGKPEISLFDIDRHNSLLEQIRLVSDIASGLEAKVLVFGAPKTRRRRQLSHAEATKIALDVIRKAGDICCKKNVVIGIEANPLEYGCDFLTNTSDVHDFVQKANHSSVTLHMDTGAIQLGGGVSAGIMKKFSDFSHFHLSEPMLNPIVNGEVDFEAVISHLKASNYKKWVSIEMKKPESQQILFDCIKMIRTYLAAN